MKLFLIKILIAIGDNFLVKKMTIWFYTQVVLFTLFKFLKYNFKTIVKVFPRHSVLHALNFNVFLSDLDFSIVVSEESEIEEIIICIKKLKKVLIFLDYPQIMTTVEFEFFQIIEKSEFSKFVESVWHFRKINWLLVKSQKTTSLLEKLKYSRAIEKSKRLVFKEPHFNMANVAKLSDLLHLEEIIQIPSKDLAMSSYAEYLASNSEHSFKLLLSRDQFVVFNALFPLDPIEPIAYPFLTLDFYKVKFLLSLNEYLLSQSSVRLRKINGEDCTNQEKWNNILLEHVAPFSEDEYGNYYVRQNSN